MLRLSPILVLVCFIGCTETTSPPVDTGTVPFVPSWILLSSDEERARATIDRAADLGIKEVQLSHNLIMNIDDLLEPERAALLERLIQHAHDRDLTAVIWAHEVGERKLDFCFGAPEEITPDIARRQEVYRRALSLLPAVDGVVLMFGSSPIEPWYVVCGCPPCERFPVPEGDLAALFGRPPPATRVRALIEAVRDVVVEEQQKKMIVRTFNHRPIEADWLREALQETPPGEHGSLVVMSKEVPQDWQLYYPTNPLIGVDPELPQIVEIDLGAEYWGQSAWPFYLVPYLKDRWSDALANGADGYAARIERGSHRALGTPNEVNIAGLRAITADPELDVDRFLLDWLAETYSLTDTDALASLASAHRRTFDVVRKMVYARGFWVLKKGSGLPSELGDPDLLLDRNTALYDAAFEPLFEMLRQPEGEAIRAVEQEGYEAVEEAERMWSDFLRAQEHLATADSAALAGSFDSLRLATRVFAPVRAAHFRVLRMKQSSDPDLLAYESAQLRRHAMELEVATASIATGGPISVSTALALVEQMRSRASSATSTGAPDFIAITEVRVQEGRVHWRTSEPAVSYLETGPRFPIFVEGTAPTAAEVVHEAPLAEGRVFRIVAQRPDGSWKTTSGDFRLASRR